MVFKAWEAKRHIEKQYRNAFHKLADWLSGLIPPEETDESEVVSLVEQASYSPALATWADAMSERMVTQTLEENAHTWRQAATMSSQGREMLNALQEELQGPVGDRVRELVDSNARLIKTLPHDVALQITRLTATQAFADNRSAYTGDTFRQLVGDMTEAHGRLISRTETAKAHTALTQARSEALGYDWYIWRTAKDGTRVRPSHRIMEDVMCRWSDPPSPEELAHEKRTYGHYHPGDIFNCRCFAESIIVATQVTWPHKVYANGSITTMQKRAFESIYGKVGD